MKKNNRLKKAVEQLGAVVKALPKDDVELARLRFGKPNEDVTGDGEIPCRTLTWNAAGVDLLYMREDGRWRLMGCFDSRTQTTITVSEAVFRLEIWQT